MSCGDLFQMFSTRAMVPQATTPVDLAMRLCLSHSPPILKLLNPYDDSQSHPEPGRQDLAKSCRGKKKKKVVFADMKGFSLTAVRIFSKIEEDLCDLHQALSHLTSFRHKFRVSRADSKKYLLDFPQPSADYSAFRRRLQNGFVSLENCVVQEKGLSGTVKVRNIDYEKKVFIRITFDLWRTFRDVPCLYMLNTYGCSDTDDFSFEVALPKAPNPCGVIEFCVSFYCGKKVYWDNNDGKNYRIRPVMGPSPPSALSHLAKSTLAVREPLGAPRAAALVLSRLQTWRRSEKQAYW
uniref:Protein phosphatase 1 regulatory subunit n=1 Tax=Salvator merianae TaxID=96440 RepID=A0A8D0E178_SALMN